MISGQCLDVLFSSLEQCALGVQHVQQAKFPLTIAFTGRLKDPEGSWHNLLLQRRSLREGGSQGRVRCRQGRTHPYTRGTAFLPRFGQPVLRLQDRTLVAVDDWQGVREREHQSGRARLVQVAYPAASSEIRDLLSLGQLHSGLALLDLGAPAGEVRILDNVLS